MPSPGIWDCMDAGQIGANRSGTAHAGMTPPRSGQPAQQEHYITTPPPHTVAICFRSAACTCPPACFATHMLSLSYTEKPVSNRGALACHRINTTHKHTLVCHRINSTVVLVAQAHSSAHQVPLPLTSGVAAAKALLQPIISAPVTAREMPMKVIAGTYPRPMLRIATPKGTPTAHVLAAARAAGPTLPPWASLPYPPSTAPEENHPESESESESRERE